LLGVILDQALGGGRLFTVVNGSDTGAGSRSLDVYWHWFEYLLSPWFAPVFLAVAGYALWLTPGLLLFSAPALALTLLRTDREPEFMLAFTPFLVLAIAVAIQRGRFGRAFWARLWTHRGFRRTVRGAGLALVALNFVWGALYVKAKSKNPGIALPEVSWPAFLESKDVAQKHR
jgi:hypothetical protein